jgi:hypothetical protein
MSKPVKIERGATTLEGKALEYLLERLLQMTQDAYGEDSDEKTE